MYHTCIIHPCFSASLRSTAHELEAALDKPLSTEDLLEDLVHELDARGLEEVRVRRREERTELVLADHVLMHWQPGEREVVQNVIGPDRLSVHEAARAFSYNYRSLQVYIRTGALVATTDAHGQQLVERSEMVRLASSLRTNKRHGVERMARSSWERERVLRGALSVRKRVQKLLLCRRERRARARAKRRGMFRHRRPQLSAAGTFAPVRASDVSTPFLVVEKQHPATAEGSPVADAGCSLLVQRALRVRHRKRRTRPWVRLPVLLHP